MRIHIGVAILGCIISIIISVALTLSLAFDKVVTERIELAYTQLALEGFINQYEDLKSVHANIESGNSDKAKIIIQSRMSAIYSTIEELRNNMPEITVTTYMKSEAKMAETFLEKNKPAE